MYFYFSKFNEFLAPLCTRLNYENTNYSRDWFEWPRNEHLLNKQLPPRPSAPTDRSIFKTRYPCNGILKLVEYTVSLVHRTLCLFLVNGVNERRIGARIGMKVNVLYYWKVYGNLWDLVEDFTSVLILLFFFFRFDFILTNIQKS